MSVNWPTIIAIVVYAFIGLVVTCTREYAYARSHGPQVWDAEQIAGEVMSITQATRGPISLGPSVRPTTTLQVPKYATTQAKRDQQRIEQEQRKPIERELDQYLDGKPLGPSNQRFPR